MSANVTVGDLVDGKYRILRVIGEGGWGVVFEAENIRTLKHVALKILRTQSLTADVIARFEREAQAAGRIGSEHIVEVFDLGVIGGNTHYMVMELLAGEELSTRLTRLGKLDAVTSVKLVAQLLEGLAAAHAVGILHRDLKPENLFLVATRSGEDFVKILDFGISKFIAAGPTFKATMTGAVMGSPCYMAPEQARGLKQVDARTDLYSVGTVLFECVTGRVPFEGDNFNDLMFQIVLGPRPSPRAYTPDLHPTLVEIIGRAISVEPAARFATASEFRDSLVAWLESQGVASARAPELRRAKATPRTSPDDSAGLPSQTPATTAASGAEGSGNWADVTMPIDVVVGTDTPIASSATVSTKKSRRRRTISVAIGALVVVATWAGIVFRRPHNQGTAQAFTGTIGLSTVSSPAPPASTDPPSAMPATTVAAVSIPHEGTTEPAEDARGQGAGETAGAATVEEAAPVRNAHPSHGRARANPSAPPPAHSSGPTASARPDSSSTPAQPAPPVEKVEGREIRSGL